MGLRSVALLLVFSAHLTLEEDSDFVGELTEGEYELQRMLSYVTPLMAILRKDQRVKRSYGGGGGYYQPSCCDEKTDYLGLISFISLGLLLLFLVALLSSTTTSAGRRKRSDDDAGNDVSEDLPSTYST